MGASLEFALRKLEERYKRDTAEALQAALGTPYTRNSHTAGSTLRIGGRDAKHDEISRRDHVRGHRLHVRHDNLLDQIDMNCG